MQYKYITCKLPSNGMIYPTKEVHLRAKTIFDIKALLGNPVFQLRSEIDALNNCIDPNDNIDVYDLVNQDVVYLLYKLRSMSNDDLTLRYNNKDYPLKISELDVKYLEKWNPNIILPESGIKVTLAYIPIKNIFNLPQLQREFENKYPDYHGDVANTVTILSSIQMFDNVTNKDAMREALETLSFNDSLFLIDEIEKLSNLRFGVIEEVKIPDDKTGKEIIIPIEITENFFRSRS